MTAWVGLWLTQKSQPRMSRAYRGSKELVTPVFLERSGKEYRGLSIANGEVGKEITLLQDKGGFPIMHIAKCASAKGTYPSPKTTLCFGENVVPFIIHDRR